MKDNIHYSPSLLFENLDKFEDIKSKEALIWDN
jgi:hypothetical protein